MSDNLQPPPPPRRRESAAEFGARDSYLCAVNSPRSDWPGRHVGDIAFTLEALGVGPDDFERVLQLAHVRTANQRPAGLETRGYRFGVVDMEHVYGEPLGVYLGLVVVARTTTPR